MERDITVQAQHLAGTLNCTADAESRVMRDRSDWMLCPNVFRVINDKVGPLKVDLFASRLTTQLSSFVSWRPDPEALLATDAFTVTWTGLKAYANPPWSLVGRVLSQARQQRADLILVAPVWKTQPWYPNVQRLPTIGDLFSQGYQYRSLNAYRSAISSVHDKVDGYDVGQHPLVSRLLKGAFHQRPPQPRYTQTWDVRGVTNYIRSMGANNSLSLQNLSHKLAMLMALTRPSRSADLANLDLKHRTYSAEGATFFPTTLSKQSRQKKHGTEFFFPNYAPPMPSVGTEGV